MHYYGFNIEAYVAHTRHLTPLEDIAYRRMLDAYYLHEAPLQGDAARVARSIGMREHVTEVSDVLEEFFTPVDGTWRNDRAETEIAAYRRKVHIASKAGKASGIARSSEAPPPASTPERPPPEPPNGGPTPVERPFVVGSTGVQLTNPNPVPQPQKGGCTSPRPSTPTGTEPTTGDAEGGGRAALSTGDGERGQETLFALLCGTTIRSKAKNRRKVLAEWATDLDTQGLLPDMFRRLRSKARQESNSDPDALLATWFSSGSWREKWDECVGSKVAGIAQRIAKARRAQ